MIFRTLVTVGLLALTGCSPLQDNVSRISTKSFGSLTDGRDVTQYTLRNEAGSSVGIIDLGGIIVSLNIPDKQGQLADIVLGLDSPQQYLTESPYLGAIVGRYANRIKEGKFSLGEQDYSLAINNGTNALHGGLVGFDKKMWHVVPHEGSDYAELKLSMVSEDGEEGYPGTLAVQVTYRFDDQNNLSVNYHATTDKQTVINLSQHSYFNLEGHASGSILDHHLTLEAGHYTPVDDSLIPTGEIAAVNNTPMDFRISKTIGRDIVVDHPQLIYGGGFDHNWVLDRHTEHGYELAATVFAPKSGRQMEVWTNQPGIQFYSGNFLDGSIVGKGGNVIGHRSGFCLETQHFPDSPNQPNFPSTLLNPGDVYDKTTIFKFSTH